MEAGRVVADKLVGAGVGEFAGGIEPDFAADFPPALAERIILAEISAGLRVDDAIEEGKEIGTSHCLAPRARHGKALHVGEVSFGISDDHVLNRAAADELKTAAGVDCRGEIAFVFTLRLRAEGSDIGQSGLA